MKEIVSKSLCCGCSSCCNSCPKKAISMKEDKNGFKYPEIDEKKCIDCGLCKKVCPIINSKERSPFDKKNIAYACYNYNINERINSSSGGIFILLAKFIINKGGVVFGAAFDEKFNVKHTYVSSIKDLKKLMGSKYVQSDIGSTYKDVKDFLKMNKYVLFTGTPCQVEGLKTFLGKDYDKLYTQDIVCHGVPSPKLWNKYLEYQKHKNNEDIKGINFRNKDNGWACYNLKMEFDNVIYSEDVGHDHYMRLFLKNICLRESCYNCQIKGKERLSDITLGDFWGVENICPNINDNKGISVIIINTEKGKQLFNGIMKDIKHNKINLQDVITYNSAIVESVFQNPKREIFFDDLTNLSFDKLVKKYDKNDSLLKRGLRKIKKIIK